MIQQKYWWNFTLCGLLFKIVDKQKYRPILICFCVIKPKVQPSVQFRHQNPRCHISYLIWPIAEGESLFTSLQVDTLLAACVQLNL